MVVETFGFLNLFGCVSFYTLITLIIIPSDYVPLFYNSDFFPVVITFLRQLPFIGTFLSLPYISGVSTISTGDTSA